MGKKKKKKQKGSGSPGRSDTTRQINIGERPVKALVGVDCPREPNFILPKEKCNACRYHNDGFCRYTVPASTIKVSPVGTAMKFNRAFFQHNADQVADSTRNYYLLTDIMHEVRDIKGYPNYTKLKTDFLSEKIKEEEGAQEAMRCRIDPCLVVTHKDDGYSISDKEVVEDIEFEVIYYLYKTYTLDGFADIQIMDDWYKVQLSPVNNMPPDMVAGKLNDHLVIGRVKK